MLGAPLSCLTNCRSRAGAAILGESRLVDRSEEIAAGLKTVEEKLSWLSRLSPTQTTREPCRHVKKEGFDAAAAGQQFADPGVSKFNFF